MLDGLRADPWLEVCHVNVRDRGEQSFRSVAAAGGKIVCTAVKTKMPGVGRGGRGGLDGGGFGFEVRDLRG